MNKVILVGTMDSKPFFSNKGKARLQFSLTTTDTYNDKEYKSWHKITLWGSEAENWRLRLSVGQLLYVEGAIQYTVHEAKQYTNIVPSSIRILSEPVVRESTKKSAQDRKHESSYDTRFDGQEYMSVSSNDEDDYEQGNPF